jgi:hypothetical protein
MGLGSHPIWMAPKSDADRVLGIPWEWGPLPDWTAVDRILQPVSLTGVLLDTEVVMLDDAAKAAAKRARWGGATAMMLAHLTEQVHRRRVGESWRDLRRRKTADQQTRALLRYLYPQLDDKAVSRSAERLLEHMDGSIALWSNERIIGEFLPAWYEAHIGRRALMTRSAGPGMEAVQFIQAVMLELGERYKEGSIITIRARCQPNPFFMGW